MGEVIRFRNARLDFCLNRPCVTSANDPIADSQLVLHRYKAAINLIQWKRNLRQEVASNRLLS